MDQRQNIKIQIGGIDRVNTIQLEKLIEAPIVKKNYSNNTENQDKYDITEFSVVFK